MTPSSDWRAPTTITKPSTSSALAKIDPMIENWATTTSPLDSAKMTTKNSGRLPSVDCSTPGHRRAEVLADLLGGERDHPGQPGEREARDDEREQVGGARVVQHAGGER